MYVNAIVASVAAVAAIAAVPVRGDSSAAAAECAYDTTSGMCVPAEMQATDAAALTITGMLGQCMANMAMTAEGGCLPSAPEFCMPHDFADEAGVQFCVTRGFTGTSYMEFEELEGAAMDCIGMELSPSCQPVVIAWYETLGCSTCAEVEFAMRTCMMRTTVAECGAGAADTRAVSILVGPGPGDDAAAPSPITTFVPTPADEPDPYADYPAASPYGDYYDDATYAGLPESYYEYFFPFMSSYGAPAPGPSYAYGPYSDAYGPDDAYGPEPLEAYSYGVPYDAYGGDTTGFAYGPEYAGYSGFDYPAYGPAPTPDEAALGPIDYGYFNNFFGVSYDYADGPAAPAEVFGRPFLSAQPPSGAGEMTPAERMRMRRARRARRMRPADPPRMRRMRMERMRRMRRMRRARMG